MNKLKKRIKTSFDSDSISRENELSDFKNDHQYQKPNKFFREEDNEIKLNICPLERDNTRFINNIQVFRNKENETLLQKEILIKKYEKIMIKTFKNSFEQDDEKLIDKLYEQYQINQEVKNIILEMSIRLKDIEYLIKNQWSILKKFNLQENIYMEESKNLAENEKVLT